MGNLRREMSNIYQNFLKKIVKPLWKGTVPADFSYPYTVGIPGAYFGFDIKPTVLFLLGFIPIVRNFFYEHSVSERIVEDPFVLQNINLKKGAKILDFGCYGSIVPLQLANLGYKIFGVDYYSYPYQHPNFRFFQIDFLDNKFESEYFDAIYAISSLEHVGIGYYPVEKEGITDQRVANEFYRILNPGGKVLVTVPIGKRKTFRTLRVYDGAEIKSLFKKFGFIKEEYYARKSLTIWKSVSYSEALSIPVPYNKHHTHEVVGCFVFERR